MESDDTCHPCKRTAKKVYIDGSSYNIGASCCSGWGIWSLDEESFNEQGPLKGNRQSSDRAEVRALVAALEKAENNIEVITDNQYVRDTAQYIVAGGTLHKGKHSDLWRKIKCQIHKLAHIRCVKAHLKQGKATAAGVCYEDWFGNNEADVQAKKGAAQHDYAASQQIVVLENKWISQEEFNIAVLENKWISQEEFNNT
eukprot:507643-Heterocapsa_arctica.AAC.1